MRFRQNCRSHQYPLVYPGKDWSPWERNIPEAGRREKERSEGMDREEGRVRQDGGEHGAVTCEGPL